VSDCILICPFLGSQLLFEEVRVKDNSGSKKICKVWKLAWLRADEIFSK